MKGKRKYLFSFFIVVAILFGGAIPARQAMAGSTPIMGKSEVYSSQMLQYYQNNNSTYPYSDTNLSTINAFVNQVISEANYEGVRPDVAFAQMMKETNFLKFGGDVQVGQYNFGGLGATGGGVPGNSFHDPVIGIRAVIQHLKAYATTASLTRPANFSQYEAPYADQRYQYVSPLGKANNYVENLSGTWATDTGYGTDIVNRINTMKSLPKFTLGTTNVQYIYGDHAATGIWNFKSDGLNFNQSLSWRSDPNNFAWERSKVTTGDYNGDGKKDVAILYDYGSGTSGIWLFLSDGTTYNPVLAWYSATGGFPWQNTKITSGDYDGDGKDDIAVAYNYSNNNTGIWVFQSSGTTSNPTLNPSLQWISGPGNFNWDMAQIVSGDFGGDQKDDIAMLYNYGGNTTGLWDFISNTNGTAMNPVLKWMSAPGQFSWNSSKLTSGNFDGVGKDDYGILYNYGNANTGVWIFNNNGTTVSPALEWYSGPGTFAWENSSLTSGDFVGDGKTDLAVFYNYGYGNSGIWTFEARGTTVNPEFMWKTANGGYPLERAILVAGNDDNLGKDDIQVIFNYSYPKTVVLDPGHGGYDPGAVANGIRESDVNLGVALKVRDILTSEGYNVLMTRSNDTYVGLQERADFSNASGGDIFVSLHSDSSGNPYATGSMGTYYHYGEGYAIDNYNAIADNNWLLNSDLAQRLAYFVAIYTGQNQRPSESHSFAVLWRNNLPATLIEMGFVTNPYTASQMATYNWQYSSARGIVSGIDSYFKNH